MNVRPLLIGLGVLLAFALISIAFFQADVIGGKALQQSDVVQFEGMSRWPAKHYEKTGENPLWNDGMFSGMPNFLLNIRVDAWVTTRFKDVLIHLIPNSVPASSLLLSMICFAVLLLSYGVRWQLVLIGAVVYAFNTYSILLHEVGHITKTWAIGFASLVLAGLHLTFQKKTRWLGVALFTVGLTAELGADHIQITYYLIFVCLSYVISEAYFRFKAKEMRPLFIIGGLLLASVIVVAGTKLTKFALNQEYVEYSIRGQKLLTAEGGEKQTSAGLDKDYAFSWSQGITETFTLIVPYFYGGGSSEKLREGTEVHALLERAVGKQRMEQFMKEDRFKVPLYFGDQPFTAGPLYAGAIVCFLFVLGIFLVDARHKYWMIIAAMLCMFFAWGRNLAFFNYFLFDYFPLFNKFRSVSMALSLSLILMPLLGFVGLEQFLRKQQSSEELQKKLYRASAVVLGLLAVALLFSFSGGFSTAKDSYYAQQYFGQDQRLVKQFTDALQGDRAGLIRSDVFRSFFLIALVVAALWLWLQQKVQVVGVLALTGVLAIGDVWLVGKRYVYDNKFLPPSQQQAHRKSAADATILQDTDPHYRVFNLQGAFQEAYTSYFHKSIGGYFAAKMQRYQDLIDRQLVPDQQKLIGALQSGSTDFSDLDALNMLNAKYFKFGDKADAVLQNPNALGNAWFIEKVISIGSPDEAMRAMDNFDSQAEAVINTQTFPLSESQFAVDSAVSVKLTSYSSLKLTYQTDNAQKGLLVFSEVYYPKGWKATIDGQEVPVIRANYTLRALEVPAGKHEIVFTFDSETFNKSFTITQISAGLYLLLVLGGIGMHFFERKKEEESEGG